MSTHSGEDPAARLREVLARNIEKEMTMRARWQPLPHQIPPPGDWMGWLLLAGRGCIAGWTRIYDPTTGDETPVADLAKLGEPITVLGLSDEGPVSVQCAAPFIKGTARLTRFTLSDGSEVTVTDDHKFLSEYGWKRASRLHTGDFISCLDLETLPDPTTVFRRIISETVVGTGEYYDLQVPGANSYLAEGIWHHNSGKTAACSNYIVNHVKGPACIPGPIPHWIGIIAPTLGDAATSCFSGPAGIRAFDDTAGMAQRVGGLVITWPNGSQAKLYGAREPDDVERLRSGGNTSLAAGTIVRTSRGQVPIEKVTVSDQVWTRNGLRNVLWSGQTGVKPLRNLTTTTSRSVSLTGDHKVWTDDGWKETDDLVTDDVLTSWDGNFPVYPEHISSPGDSQPVYDLTVDRDHEFFANDVLVSNCAIWAEELAAWRYLQDAFDQMRFGLRMGKRPRWIGSTTPKPRPLIKRMYAGEIRGIAVTHATMYDNPHLPSHIKDALEEAYAGSTVGSQELYGKLIEQDENALWTREIIEAGRLKMAPDLRKVAVGVDPSGGAGEQGIVVVGAGQTMEIPPLPESIPEGVTLLPVATRPRLIKQGYVLHDASVRMKPEGWARTAVEAAVDWDADAIVVETNFGGDMAVATLVGAADSLGVSIPIKTVHASRGKAPRAQPVAAMAVQNRWHHVGTFDELEDQLCSWVPGDSDWSPDRIDACLVAGTMILTSTGEHSIEEIAPGDSVWTRDGWKTVLRAERTAEAATVGSVLLSSGRQLCGTPDHRVRSGGRWITLDSLVCADRLSGWEIQRQTDIDIRFVPVNVVHPFAVETQRADVFNLEVDGLPEYVAEGVIVHNCVWPAWYLKLVSTILRSVGTFGGSEMSHRSLVRRRLG